MKGEVDELPKRAAAAVCLAVVGGLMLVPLADQARPAWVAKAFDLAHLPLFAVLTFSFWLALKRKLWLACLLAVVAAALLEILQIPVGREGSFDDFLRGVVGTLLAAVALYGRRGMDIPRKAMGNSQPEREHYKTGRRPGIVTRAALAAGLLAWPLADAWPEMADAWHSYRSFPVLADFETRWQTRRWGTEDAWLERVSVGTAAGEAWSGRLVLLAEDSYSAAVLFPVMRNWQGYRRLHCEFSVEEEPLRLELAVRDGRKIEPPLRRFKLQQRFEPGRHRVSIDLNELAAGSQFAPVDLSSVTSFHVVAVRLERPQTLLLHRVYLQ